MKKAKRLSVKQQAKEFAEDFAIAHNGFTLVDRTRRVIMANAWLAGYRAARRELPRKGRK